MTRKRPSRSSGHLAESSPAAPGRKSKADTEAMIGAAVSDKLPSKSDALSSHASPLSLTRAVGKTVDQNAAWDRPAVKNARGVPKGSRTNKQAKLPIAVSRDPDGRKPAGKAFPAETAAAIQSAEVDGSAKPSSTRVEAELIPASSPANTDRKPVRENNDKPLPGIKPAHEGADQPINASSGLSDLGEIDDPPILPEMETLARNVSRFIESSGQAAAAYLKPRGGGVAAPPGEEMVQTLNSLGRVAESWMANPTRMIQAQVALSTRLFSIWTDSFSRLGEEKAKVEPPVAVRDKRFAAPEWKEAPFFDFLHQAYLVTTDWAKTIVADAEGIDEATRDKAAFYLRQISSALSPSNFLATNPELLKETFKEKGENLVRGMQMLAEDIAAGKGEIKIRQSDASKFTLGVDMASTPGKVVYRNDLMELIQYAPSTGEVLKRPLLIVPPWINKFYVLDLNQEKSFIRWMVSQGLTTFVISWVNPDERHAQKDWDAYMREGILAAVDAIEAATGERDVSTVGYCVGGTLLAATLAYMAVKGDKRVSSSTFLTTQVDFEEAGDLKVFADEAQIRVVERQMTESGYLAGSKMANAFNMLRPDDLIWSYSVNAYLKGKAPAPFDLLAWNSDSTRMSAANHAFYLRNCYLENKLTKGDMVIGGEKLNLADVTIPIYDLAAKEDHIAPARSVFTGAKSFGGPVRYVMAGSGHIAGVVNPPSKAKYQYWTGERTNGSFEEWIDTATEIKGTWWLDWIEWIKMQAPETVPQRVPGEGGLMAICDAPGEYVRVQS